MPPPEDRPSPPGRVLPGPLAGMAPAAARAVLLDAWVADGRRGYFVDLAACAAGQAFSLYETMWRLHLLERSGRGHQGVTASRVAVWLDAALDGRLASSGLPAIGQLWYAVRILSMLGSRPPGERVGAAVAALRDGGRYSAALPVTGPDWGSTALAVAMLTELGQPVPAEVTETAATAVTGFGRAGAASAGLTSVVPLLQVAAAVGGSRSPVIPAAALARLVRAAESALRRLPRDPAWLAHLAALRRAAALLGVPPGQIDRDRCARLLDSDGSVRLPGQPGPDAQATYYALELGCPGARAPAPAPCSRAGWPTARASAGGVAASLTALRAAAALGIDERFRAPLARQLTEVWLPGSTGQPRPQGGGPDPALAKLLAAVSAQPSCQRSGQ